MGRRTFINHAHLVTSALQFAVETRRPGLVSLLVGAGARLQRPVLHTAVRLAGYVTGQEIALLLASHGAEVTEPETEEAGARRPLDWAVAVNSLELCEELLRLGARPHSVPTQLLATASPQVRSLIVKAKSGVPTLEHLAKIVIRSSLVNVNSITVSNGNTSTFRERLFSLHLPQKLLSTIL